MADRSILVIGAGLAGLSTGVYARLNGYHVHVLERHTISGGVCTSWKRKGFEIDGCIHWLMGCTAGTDLRRIYEEVGAWDEARLAPITHFVRQIDEAGGVSLDVTADLDRLQADLLALSPVDAPLIHEMMAAVRRLRGFDMPVARAQDLMGPLEGLKLLWGIRRQIPVFARYNKVSCAQFSGRFQSPVLRRFLNFVPEMPVSFFFVVLAGLADHDFMAWRGGSRGFAQAIERRLRDLGGQLTFKADVQRILVEGGRAVGVRLADGRELRSDVVVSAADAHATLFGMLEGKYLTPRWKAAFDGWPLFRPVCLVSFGVSAGFDAAPASFTCWIERPFACAGVPVDSFHVRLFRDDPQVAAEGEGVVQVTLETGWDGWDQLSRGPREAYDAAKEALASEVVARLERHLPGLGERVVMTDVATPATFLRFANVYRGAYEGWLPTVASQKVKLERTLPGLAGFHLVGQWVEPGGGVPPALFGGRHLVQRLCREDGKEFCAGQEPAGR